MKKSLSFVLAACAIITLNACNPTQNNSQVLENPQDNPLFVKRYWDELLDRMVQMEIQNDPALHDKKIADIVERVRIDALRRVQEIAKAQHGALTGNFLTVHELTDGTAMVKDGTLYFSPHFATYPGPDLRVYLSNVVDPRDASFPDESALDLGKLKTPYGIQSYVLTDEQKMSEFRTVVLFDAALHRLYAFAQLSQ